MWAACCTSTKPSTSPIAIPRLSASSSPSPSPTPTHSVTTFGPLQLVSRTFGVVAVARCREPGGACHDHLAATEDMGRTWTDISPTLLPNGIFIYSVFFLDRQHGWVIAGSCEPSQATIYRTVDGGRRWHGRPTDAPDCHAGSTVRTEFVDPSHGWLMRESFVGESSTLRRTIDGGHSWTKAKELDRVGDVMFTDRSHGWHTTFGPKGRPRLLRSSDAGRTWTPVHVPGPECCSGWHETMDLPTFRNPNDGVMPLVLTRDGGTEIEFASTHDGGETWRISGSLGTPELNGHVPYAASTLISIADPTTWWVEAPSPAVFRTNNGGATWHRSSVAKVTRLTSIQALDARRAWITGNDHGQSMFYGTRDGGRSWRAIEPIASPGVPTTSIEVRGELALPGVVTALTAGPGGSLFAIDDPNTLTTKPQRVVRFDPSTGQTVESPPIPIAQGGVDRLAFAGDSVWVAAGAIRRRRHSDRLYQLDGTTLAIRRRLTMEAAPIALASVAAGLWVAAGTHLELVDPWTSSVIRDVTFAGHVEHLVASPDGSRLYIATDAPASPRYSTPCWSSTRGPGGRLLPRRPETPTSTACPA
jgi:photosystem II stability/assembly factor-like uncharacterized protein